MYCESFDKVMIFTFILHVYFDDQRNAKLWTVRVDGDTKYYRHIMVLLMY